jgi:hypothetical protein
MVPLGKERVKSYKVTPEREREREEGRAYQSYLNIEWRYPKYQSIKASKVQLKCTKI